MSGGLAGPIVLAAAIVYAVLFLAAPADPTPNPPGEDLAMELAELVPESLGPWQRSGEDARYDRESIFKYMDGAGEIYLCFAFRELFVRRFRPAADLAAEEITVELYDMGNSADAFGIFSRNRAGPDVGVGQGSEYRSGYLVFWQDRYFVTVFTRQETDRSRQAVLELGRSIAAAVPRQGNPPDLVAMLPKEDLVSESVRYFHRHTDLNHHYFLAEENLLDLGPRTDAVIASYRRPGEFLFLLIVRYANQGLAESAHRQFIGGYLPEGQATGIARIEDGSWAAAALAGIHLVAVFDAPTPERAAALLGTARERITREGG